ncbi:hypothetical protein EDB92DRAFT_1950562 [Lactarius akahatsu]|uniref:Uncharacterized protein n=1 Tax=Lactarius akahatsu TaxID=416441 RepID=A0AAD4QAC1_9AGAM|nr:hypothetical protein EDB92DRAFT_1950562 [Lactarius akahatsu]
MSLHNIGLGLSTYVADGDVSYLHLRLYIFESPYGGSLELDPPAPEDEDNILAALKQSDRIISISLTITNSLLEKLSAIERPFSELENLVLLSRDGLLLALPFDFRWGLM